MVRGLEWVGWCVLGGCWLWCREGFFSVMGFCGGWDKELAEWVEIGLIRSANALYGAEVPLLLPAGVG